MRAEQPIFIGFAASFFIVFMIFVFGCTLQSSDMITIDRSDITMSENSEVIKLPPTLNPSLPTPKAYNVELHDVSQKPIGFTRLEHRIVESDVIVRARLREIRATACETDTDEWRAVLQYHFEVFEYLKGSDSYHIHVNTSFIDGMPLGGGTGNITSASYTVYSSQEDAEHAAISRIAELDLSLISLESIVFLEQSDTWTHYCKVYDDDSDSFYSFTLQGHFAKPYYSIHSDRNRVWLPGLDTDQTEPAFRLSIDSSVSTDRDLEWDQFGTVSTDELKQQIDTIASLTSNDPNYEECLKSKNRLMEKDLEAQRRGGEIHYHWSPSYTIYLPDRSIEVPTALFRDRVVIDQFKYDFQIDSEYANPKINTSIKGPDSDLFELRVISMDRYYVKYAMFPKQSSSITKYQIEIHFEITSFEECDGYIQNRMFNMYIYTIE